LAAPLNLSELGTTGLKRSSGVVIDEPLPLLRGARGRKIFAEMATDPVIAAFLFAVEKVIGQLAWRVEAPDVDGGEEAAEFVESCLFDMSDTWDSTIAEILSCLVYGWSYHEIIYKRRVGPDQKDPTRRSKHTDGKIGWRKWSPRAQETLWQWEFDEDSGIQGMIQVDPWTGHGQVLIPIEKALLFRTTSRRANPEGVSILRGAHRPWYFRKRIEEIEAIGVERDLAGLPVAWVDPAFLSSNATPEQVAVLAAVTSIVQNVKRNEQEGVVYPLAYDERGNKMFDLTLMSSGGTRQFDTDAIVSRYDQRIAMSVLADWLMLGHENVGSFALGTSKMGMWALSVDAIAKAIAGVVNEHAIPRLLTLNGIKMDEFPSLRYGEVGEIDLTAIADYVSKIAAAGFLTPDDTIEAHLREVGSLPPAENPNAHEEAAAEEAENKALMAEQMAAGQVDANGEPIPPADPAKPDAEDPKAAEKPAKDKPAPATAPKDTKAPAVAKAADEVVAMMGDIRIVLDEDD
jgi:hypothetical protein